MRSGYRVVDMDTHVVPHLEVLEKYSEPSFRSRYGELDPYKRSKTLKDGSTVSDLRIAPIPYDRFPGAKIGQEEVAATAGGRSSLEGRIGNRHHVEPAMLVEDENSEGRLADMDTEGRDIDYVFPASFARSIVALDDITLGRGLYRAYHNYMREYSAIAPDRIKSGIQVNGADVEASVSELKEFGNDKWVSACWIHLPHGLPIDDPSLEPIWATMNEFHLPLTHHTFQTDVPYFPGYHGDENWGNIIAVRTFAHPWGAQRLFAYVILSGILDRYPNTGVSVSEAGFGWLPNFVLNLGFNLNHLRSSAPDLKYTPLEYAKMGRVRAAVDQLEGPEMTKAAIDVLGEDCLMFQSDYPHPQSEFPDTCQLVMDFPIWDALGESAKRKLMAENAEKFIRV